MTNSSGCLQGITRSENGTLSMSNNAWSLPTACFSIVVKAAAVDRSYPGGRDQFVAVYRPQFRNGALFGLVAMSLDTVDAVLAELHDNGLLPREDIAVGDMILGPIMECSGLRFVAKGGDDMPPWVVEVVDAEEQPGQPAKHTVCIDYGYDTHEVEISEATYERLQSGQPVSWLGTGFLFGDEGFLEELWEVDLGSRAASITLPNGAEFHARRMWIDGVVIDLG